MPADTPSQPPTTNPQWDVLAHDLIVGERVRRYAHARYGVIVLMLLAGFVAAPLLGLNGLNDSALLVLAAAMVVYNALILAGARRWSEPVPTHAGVGRLQRLLELSVLLDYLALTAAVWIVGGSRSPFLAFYLFHLVVTAFLLPRRMALLMALLAIALLDLLVLGELTGVIPVHTPTGVVPTAEPLTAPYALTVLGVYTALFVLISVSATGLVARLRAAELESHRKTLELEKLSSMRREFLLLALHNMNSPLAAVTMLLRNLHEGVLGPLDPRHDEQIGRAMKRLDGLGAFLADLRKLSELKRADLHDHSTEISLGFLLGEVLDDYRDQAAQKNLSVRMEPGERSGLVFGVPRLLREALDNYVTNAIKYTPAGGSITGRVTERDGRVRAEVSDTGVGLSPEDIGRVFHEFVRVGRTNPKIKQEKGSGLGLSLVKQIAEAHAGTVGVDSTPGRGSTFWIELPACGSPDAPKQNPASTAARPPAARP